MQAVLVHDRCCHPSGTSPPLPPGAVGYSKTKTIPTFRKLSNRKQGGCVTLNMDVGL